MVQTIEAGNGPTAVASTADGSGVWVANRRDSTVVRLDVSGAVGEPVGVAAGPVAIAADTTGLWVASEEAAAVTRIDLRTGATLGAPILLQPARPVAIATGHGSVWVASSDGTVMRIDPEAYRVTDTVTVGGRPTAILATEGAIWLADRLGEIKRLDPGNLGSPSAVLATGSAPSSLAQVDGEVWAAAGARTESHMGGTIREVFHEAYPHSLDPAVSIIHDAAYFLSDGLVGYRRTGGVAGATLLPNLARTIPTPTNGGLTYTFQLRPGILYSNGQPLEPADFRRAIERSFQVADLDGYAQGSLLFASIVGAEDCLDPSGEPLAVQRCDLSSGIATDATAGTVIFHLSEPDPELLDKLTLPNAFPIPEGVPMNEAVEGTYPGTGPYVVSSVSQDEITFSRNPHFSVWDADVRPNGFADQIVWQIGADAEELAAMVERNEADVMWLGGPNEVSPESMARLQLSHPGQLHFGSVSVRMAELNPSRPPFDDPLVRRALNLAVDRSFLAELRAGSPAAVTTCQVLAPGATAYQPYCPHTFEPDLSGQWHGPDLDEAHRLVAQSSAAGSSVVVGPVFERHAFVRDYLVDLLNELGFDATADLETSREYVDDKVFGQGDFQIVVATYPSGFELLAGFTCPVSGGLYCDEGYDRLVDEAQALAITDPPASIEKWAAVDRMLVDLGWVMPVMNEGVGFVSERVGNYQFQQTRGILIDQMWVR